MSLAGQTDTHAQPAHAHQDHAHHDHAHDHAHDHHAREPVSASMAVRAHPGLSLLRMSSMQRLAMALAFSGAIWAGVFWAWS